MSVSPQAKKRGMKHGERSPPRHVVFCSSGRIWHGPTFRFLARPREEARTDVENETEKRRESVLFRSELLKTISLPD